MSEFIRVQDSVTIVRERIYCIPEDWNEEKIKEVFKSNHYSFDNLDNVEFKDAVYSDDPVEVNDGTVVYDENYNLMFEV